MSNEKNTIEANQPDAAIDTARLLGVRPETDADSRALNELIKRFQPGEQFDSWGAPVRRAKYRLDRLFKQGFLDRRLELRPSIEADGLVAVYYWLKG